MLNRLDLATIQAQVALATLDNCMNIHSERVLEKRFSRPLNDLKGVLQPLLKKYTEFKATLARTTGQILYLNTTELELHEVEDAAEM